MSKRILTLLVILVFSTISLFSQTGGYMGPGLDVITVMQAKQLRDDTPVRLQGKIERFLGDEKYLFSDATGKITIEIDDDIWKGLVVDENDTVEIIGEVDKTVLKVEIDVDSIKKLTTE